MKLLGEYRHTTHEKCFGENVNFNYPHKYVKKGKVIKITLDNTKINFVYHDWGCISIYQPLSYLFRSLKRQRI